VPDTRVIDLSLVLSDGLNTISSIVITAFSPISRVEPSRNSTTVLAASDVII
jgi:hypothetical protein